MFWFLNCVENHSFLRSALECIPPHDEKRLATQHRQIQFSALANLPTSQTYEQRHAFPRRRDCESILNSNTLVPTFESFYRLHPCNRLRGNADRSQFIAFNSNIVCSYSSKSDNSDRFSLHVCIPTGDRGNENKNTLQASRTLSPPHYCQG